MIKYIRFYLAFSKLILFGVIAVTLYFSFLSSNVDFDFSMERLFQLESSDMGEYKEFQRVFGDDGAVLFVGFKSPGALSDVVQEEIEKLSTRIHSDVSGVTAVYSVRDALKFFSRFNLPPKVLARELQTNPLFLKTLVSTDGRTACLWILLDPKIHTEQKKGEIVDKIRLILDQELGETGLTYHLAGLPAIEHEYAQLSQRDLMTFLTLAVALLLVLLGLYFRNLFGTFLPLITVSIAVVWVLGILKLVSIPLGVMTGSVPTLLLIVCISDTIHILSRYQEDLKTHGEKREAIAWTLLTMVGACFLTSVTTSVGFFSLVTADVYVIREFGLVTGGGILLAYVVSILFVPSVLDNLPPFRARVLDRFADEYSNAVLTRVARLNVRWRYTVVGIGGGIVLLSLIAAMMIRRESSWLQDIPEQNKVRVAHEFFQKNLGSVFTLDLQVDGPAKAGPGYFNTPEALQKLDVYAQELSTWKYAEDSRSHVVSAFSYPTLLKEINRARLVAPQLAMMPLAADKLLRDESLRRLPKDAREVEGCLQLLSSGMVQGGIPITLLGPESRRTRITLRVEDLTSRAMEAFRDDATALAARVWDDASKPAEERVKVTLTGKSWLAGRAEVNIMTNMLSSLVLAGVLICAATTFLFRSLRVGLVAMIPNIIPILVTAGFMGVLGIRLNFSTVTIYSISLGLAVDNTIHYISRFRLELGKDNSARRATYRTIRGAGRPMIFAGMLFCLGFATLMTSNFKFTFYFGLLGSFTVLVALLCDLFITPSLFLIFKPRVTRWEFLEKRWKDFDGKLAKLLRLKSK